MFKLIVSLSSSWVMSRFGDSVNPVELLARKIQEQFGGRLSVEVINATSLSVTIRDGVGHPEEIAARIQAIFTNYYSDDASKVISFRAENVGGSADSSDEIKKMAEQRGSGSFGNENKGAENFGGNGGFGGFGGFGGGLGGGEAIAKGKGSAEGLGGFGDFDFGGGAPKGGISSVTQQRLDEINDLVGAEEFKALAKEIADIAPQIKKNKTFDVLSRQSYIFSIDNGYGMSTYLNAFAKLLASLDLPKISNIRGIVEEKITIPSDDRDDPFLSVKRCLTLSDENSLIILCIDICDWMSKVNNYKFRAFFEELANNCQNHIIFFRIPFVEKDVLKSIKESINDRLFVRTVSVPHFNHDELQACAIKEIGKYGFTVEDDAWNSFHVRIAEEKRDGKFYGINTVHKIVRELLYNKQLSNARLEKDDTVINQRDTSTICSSLDYTEVSGFDMLNGMVCGEFFKNKIDEIVAQVEFARKTPGADMPCIHMRFLGNPGTGKTTVARIIGKIFKEKGILRIGNFFEYAGRDFCGQYVGHTAPKTAAMCRDAYGSVLFIDEAYSLYKGDDNDRDFGREALDTLIAEMENNRRDLVVIMAGYTDEMNTLMEGNAGLASRMPYVIEFPNFTREQLYDIFVSMISKNHTYDEDILPAAKDYFMSIPDEFINSKEFSNARFVRNLFERTVAKASMRCQLNKIETVSLTKDDFDRSIADKEFTFASLNKKTARIGFAT